ncbi:MAG: ArgE/DapE family deacylase [Gemmatimonadota bacterium]
MAELTRELVAIPTENPPGARYPACLDLLERRMRELSLPVETIRLDQDRTALLCGVGSGPTLYLHGHYDVVPASFPDQFRPITQGGRIIGRGSADMKGAIAAMIHAVAALSGTRLSGRVEVVLVPDEETGGEHGSRRLLELGRLGRDGVGAILGEPTSGAIWNANRGAITLRVEVRGRPAHVGLHYQGVNAFEHALPILTALERLKAEVETRRTDASIGPDAARRSILMLGGEVSGGHQFNVVPELFAFTVERRFNPEEDLSSERDRLLSVIQDASPPGSAVSVSILQEGQSSGTAVDTSFYRAAKASVSAVTGREPTEEMCPGLLESRFYAQAGVPAIAYGPGDLEVSHGPDESVVVERIVECAQAYALTALDLFSTPSVPLGS